MSRSQPLHHPPVPVVALAGTHICFFVDHADLQGYLVIPSCMHGCISDIAISRADESIFL
jgi:hypothetical protein